MADSLERTVLLVGHCTPDAYALRTALSRHAPDAAFVFVNDDAALKASPADAPMLVNRVLDGRFAAEGGIELIRALPPDERRRAALVSDFPEAQAEAEAEGASPGFGKRQMYAERARACILSLLDQDGAPVTGPEEL